MSALNDDLVEAVAAMSDDDLVAAAAFDGDPAFIAECERRDRKMMAEAGAETVAALRDDLARITAIRIVTGELDPVAPDGDSYSLTDDAQTALKWLLAMAMMPGPSEREALRDALARDAQSSPPDLPLMQVDHAQPVPSSPDSGESRSRAAGPDAEQAEPRRAGAPPPEASSYACERADRVEPLEGMAKALARTDMNIAWDRLDRATRQHYLGMARSASGTLPDWRSVAEDMALLVQILWARYPAFISPAELVDFMDSLPDDLLHALMASTGQTHKAAAWDNDHPTCVLIRSLDDSKG